MCRRSRSPGDDSEARCSQGYRSQSKFGFRVRTKTRCSFPLHRETQPLRRAAETRPLPGPNRPSNPASRSVSADGSGANCPAASATWRDRSAQARMSEGGWRWGRTRRTLLLGRSQPPRRRSHTPRSPQPSGRGLRSSAASASLMRFGGARCSWSRAGGTGSRRWSCISTSARYRWLNGHWPQAAARAEGLKG